MHATFKFTEIPIRIKLSNQFYDKFRWEQQIERTVDLWIPYRHNVKTDTEYRNLLEQEFFDNHVEEL